MNLFDKAGCDVVGVLPPMHPGEVLREDFLKPHGVSPGKVARAVGIPRTRIERVAREELGVTADTAVRLGLYFGTTTEFWLNLQARYDAQMAAETRESLAQTIEPIRRNAA